MSNPQSLEAFDPSHDFLIGIDSDGCVFDSMEIKHKECFCPAFINHFDLQAASKYAREVWEFVNLYSRTRGANRFKAVLRALDLVAGRSEVKRRGVTPPVLAGLVEWVRRERKLGNPALIAEVERSKDADLAKTLEWSVAVNEAVSKIVRNVPPFPGVAECLAAARPLADLIVVSQTPTEALLREWEEHGIANSVALIAGQELGTKSDHLRATTAERYEADHVLMIGDAPGDRSAAKSVGALFYPIIPGAEERCWQRLVDEAIPRFFDGNYAGTYEAQLAAEFDAALPETPRWEVA